MAVDIVVDCPRGHHFRRLLRGILVIVGMILILAALLASTIPLLVATMEIVSLVLRRDPPKFDKGFGITLAVATGVMVIGLLLGLKLIRGRRRSVLFLRRFGFIPATTTLSYAVARAAGRRWRLVTLDDLRVAAVGVRRRVRWTAGSIALVALAAVTAGAIWIFGGSFDRFLNTTVNQASESSTGAGAAIAGVLGGTIAAVLVLVFVIVVMAFFGSTMLFAFGSYRSVKKAERSKAREIRTQGDIEPTVRSVSRGARRILGARLVVVRVESEIWKPVIAELARNTSAIVVDVSQPTENLLWEITAIKPEFGSRWILVGQYDSVVALRAPIAPSAQYQPAERLAFILDGEQILAYRSAGRSDMRRFAKGLRGKLEQLR